MGKYFSFCSISASLTLAAGFALLQMNPVSTKFKKFLRRLRHQKIIEDKR
jgi:hypothetical protein